MRCFGVLVGSLLVAAVGQAQQFPDYFPLQTGNQWVYRTVNNTGFVTISIAGTQDIGGITYAVMLYNGDPATAQLFRNDGAGRVYSYDPVKQMEALAYDFTKPVSNPTIDGTPYTITEAGKYSGPLGDFTNAFEIGRMNLFVSTTEIFLPYIGKVSSSSRSLEGSASLVAPMVQNLVYARLNEITVLTTKDWGFGLTLDRAVYHLQFGQTDDCQILDFPGQTATASAYRPCALARLTLRVAGNDPVHLSFPTQQLYELELRDAAGNVVWRLSDTRTYGPKPREFVVGPGEMNFVEVVPLYTPGVFPAALLPAGGYTLTGRLVDMAGGSGSASLKFSVVR